MKVYALVGKSGTGKSYRAMSLAAKKNISAIIDDGLFISGAQVIAGTSAKREQTKLGAIKTALFTKDEHQSTVIEKIKEVNPDSILILGTSNRMVEQIASRLNLPLIEEIIYIEDITTKEERSIAQRQRKEFGKHVIPAPTVSLKNDFSGYFLHPIRMVKRFGFPKHRNVQAERTVVRPTYSYLGEFFISKKVVRDIVMYLGMENAAVAEVLSVISNNSKAGVELTVIINMIYGFNVIEQAELLQREIAQKIEEITAFNIEFVNIKIKGLV
ncbi:MAG: hypothetical protein ACTTH0_04145 [Eubacteriales bacterium]